jgi:hypothetical protein
VAEIPAKKLKRGWRKKKFAGGICGRKLAELFPELAELFLELAKLFLCTGCKIISGPGNTGSSIYVHGNS